MPDKTKLKAIAVRVIITFFEAAVAFLAATNGWSNIGSKTVLAGAVGAGISAVYNLGRHILDSGQYER